MLLLADSFALLAANFSALEIDSGRHKEEELAPRDPAQPIANQFMSRKGSSS